MTIVVNGWYRSGSTLVANVAREVIGAGTVEWLPVPTINERMKKPGRQVFKNHQWIPPQVLPPYVYVITTIRPFTESIESLKRIGADTTKPPYQQSEWETLVNSTLSRGATPRISIVPYSDNMTPSLIAELVSRLTRLPISYLELVGIQNRWNRQAVKARASKLTEIEQETLLHPNHVS